MKVKVYITKYCLTQGIKEYDGEAVGDKFITEQSAFIYNSDEFFTSHSEAKKDAEYRRNKKIQQLQKQIEKLKEMTF